jgi:hypothetical protein
MDWLDLVGPSAAILALFVVVGLAVQAIRQGRAIRRLEQRLIDSGNAAAEASLKRIAQLQARPSLSQGVLRPPRRLPPRATAIGAAALVLVLALGGVWFLFLRGDDNGSASARTNPPPGVRPEPPVDPSVVPANPPEVSNKLAITVSVWNASGVTGAAMGTVGPRVQEAGYTIGDIDNAPNGETDRPESAVFYRRGMRIAAYNVARDLGLTKNVHPPDGFTTEQLGEADVVVMVGRDLAGG